METKSLPSCARRLLFPKREKRFGDPGVGNSPGLNRNDPILHFVRILEQPAFPADPKHAKPSR